MYIRALAVASLILLFVLATAGAEDVHITPSGRALGTPSLLQGPARGALDV